MLGTPLLVAADERSTMSSADRAGVAEMLRGRRRSREEKEEENEEDAEGLSELCERHHDLSAESLANPIELGTAAPRFSTALGLIASRPWRGAVIPLWTMACAGPSFRGPGGLLDHRSHSLVAWLERIVACLVLLAVPIHLCIANLEKNWPAAYGSCLRETFRARRRRSSSAVGSPKPPSSENVVGRIEIGQTESVDGNDDDAASSQTSKNKSPTGAGLLECVGMSIGPLTALALIGAVVLYVRDATRLSCRVTYVDDDHQGARDKSNRRIEYPWSCTWASAAWFSTRLVDAALLPMLSMLVATFVAHCLAIREAAISGGDPEERVRLVDEANALWRWPLRAILSVNAVLLALIAAAFVFRRDHDATLYAVVFVVDAVLLAVPVVLITAINVALADPPYFIHSVFRPLRLLAATAFGVIVLAVLLFAVSSAGGTPDHVL